MTQLRLTALLAGCVSVAAVGAAGAGGFNRGTANLDGLYGTGNFGIYSGVTYVSPGRSYETASGLVVDGAVGPPPIRPFAQTDLEFAGDYYVPYASVGGRLMGNLSCVGSYSQPYGADSEYTGDIRYHIAEQTLSSNEYGLTCGYGFDLAKGRLSVIGGVFYETIEFGQARNFETAFGPMVVQGNSRIDIESEAWGYRFGIGYEIPEIALKAQLMYRSQTNHDASGRYTNTPFTQLAVLANNAVPGTFTAGQVGNFALATGGLAGSTSATTSGSLPQSVELSLQSGIAPDWLAFGTIKWTDWSVLQQLQLVEGINGTTFSTSRFFFNDGWTVTGGVAHRFNEMVAGSLSLTWDKGVTSGWDTLTDTWTVGAGVSFDPNENMNFRLGGAAIYFTDGVKSQTASAVDYTATSPSEWGFAFMASGSLKF